MFVTITKTRRFFFFAIVTTKQVHVLDIPKGWVEA